MGEVVIFHDGWTEDKWEFMYPVHEGEYRIADMTGLCYVHVHIHSPEALSTIQKYDEERNDEFEEWESYYEDEYDHPPQEPLYPEPVHHEDYIDDSHMHPSENVTGTFTDYP